MPDFDTWFARVPSLANTNNAVLVGRWIAEKPTTVTTVSRETSDANPDPQVVRLEPVTGSVETPTERGGSTMTIAEHYVVIHGYKNHPTAADTDIQRGDRLNANGVIYDVVNVLETFDDRLLASARVSE